MLVHGSMEEHVITKEKCACILSADVVDGGTPEQEIHMVESASLFSEAVSIVFTYLKLYQSRFPLQPRLALKDELNPEAKAHDN